MTVSAADDSNVSLEGCTESLEEWALKSHLKESTVEVLRKNEVESVNVARLLTADDIKKLPIRMGQAKLLEYAVKKLKRSDTSLNNSKDTTLSRGSSPDRRSDSFYIVPSHQSSGRKSPARFSQVEVNDPEDPDGSPCTIRITIETKPDQEEGLDGDDGGFIEELDPARNLIQELGAPSEEEAGKEEHTGEKGEPAAGRGEESGHQEAIPEEVEEEEKEEEDQLLPEGECDDTRVEEGMEVEGLAIPPPPPQPIVLPEEVKKVSLEYSPGENDIPVSLAADRHSMTIPFSALLGGCTREDAIKMAARRIVAQSMADRGEDRGSDEDDHTRNQLAAFFEGSYGSTLIRLSNDQGTLKFLVPQLSEQACQTEEAADEEEAAGEEGRECDKDQDSISGELHTPLCDLPPPAEDDEERDRMPDPPAIEEPCEGVPTGVDRKESVAFDPNNNPNAIPNFHIPPEVNKFGNYMQVQMLGEDLHKSPTTRRPMSPVVSQPIRWECNRKNSPPRTANKNTSPVRHRTPSPQRFKSPDRAAVKRGVTNGAPAGTAYRASGEIDPRAKESPPKEIVNKIKSNIESPKRGGQKPRSPSPVKTFDAESFRLARKLAQEVADCPPDCIMVRAKDLQKCPKALLPPELDKAHLEEYISDTEFRRTLGMSRDEYETYSEWRQQEVKKEQGLF